MIELVLPSNAPRKESMAITVKWYNSEKTIILQKREPGWTWDEFDAAVDQYVDMAISADHKVVIMVDCLDAPDAPTTSAIPHYQRASKLKPKNLGLMVIVSVGGFLETMGQVYTRATHERKFLQFVRSVPEAEELCAKELAFPDFVVEQPDTLDKGPV
jgi:hypothetical protein